MSVQEVIFLAALIFDVINIGGFLVGVTIMLVVAMVRGTLDWPGVDGTRKQGGYEREPPPPGGIPSPFRVTGTRPESKD